MKSARERNADDSKRIRREKEKAHTIKGRSYSINIKRAQLSAEASIWTKAF